MTHPMPAGPKVIMDSGALRAEIARARAAADLAGRGARVVLWLAASLACGLAAMTLFARLCAMEAAARAAAGV